MKETTKMSRAVSQLEHIYNNLNTDFFSGALPIPIITVQSKPGTYGYCTTAKVWRRKDDGAFELTRRQYANLCLKIRSQFVTLDGFMNITWTPDFKFAIIQHNGHLSLKPLDFANRI